MAKDKLGHGSNAHSEHFGRSNMGAPSNFAKYWAGSAGESVRRKAEAVKTAKIGKLPTIIRGRKKYHKAKYDY